MSIAYLSVLIAALLPYILVTYAKFSTKGYDNRKPREFLGRLEGRALRAHYAQLNSFEAFPAFAAAVFAAQLAGVNPQTISMLALLFVSMRVCYGLIYIFDKSALRSLVWFAAVICVIILFILAIISIS